MTPPTINDWLANASEDVKQLNIDLAETEPTQPASGTLEDKE